MIRFTRLFSEFFESERSSGYVLIGTTIFSLLLANVFLGETLGNFFHQKIGFANSFIHLDLSVEHWVNDGLMTIFFLLVGLEIERELYIGELSNFKNASMPLFAAVGGMAVPFLIHLVLNIGTPTQSGAGIPMATDIAFAIGILSLAKRVPYSLKVFLTAFAIIDDLGAILVIAFFYTKGLQLGYLLFSLLFFLILFILNRLKVYSVWPYILLGLGMWYCMLQSGVHATLTGVMLAFAMPFGKGDENSLSYKVQQWLHKPVAFIVLPIFALVNTSIVISATLAADLQNSNSLGIILGLVIGKPLGILLLCFITWKIGISNLPAGMGWAHLTGAGTLGGIGFTMSIFISLLAYDDPALVTQSKMAILVASTIASVLGLFILSLIHKEHQKKRLATENMRV